MSLLGILSGLGWESESDARSMLSLGGETELVMSDLMWLGVACRGDRGEVVNRFVLGTLLWVVFSAESWPSASLFVLVVLRGVCVKAPRLRL